MKKILYILRNFQAENYGDLLINDYLIAQLSLHCQVEILYHEKNFKLLQGMNCLQSGNVTLIKSYPDFDRQFLWMVITQNTPYEYICLIPGHSSFKNFKSKIIQIKNASFLLLLQSFGIKCIWVCKSLDISGFVGKLLEKILSNSIYKYSVRDSLSNLNNDLNAEVWPDLAFLMPPNEQKNLSSHSIIIFSFRGDRGETSQSIVKSFCLSITRQNLSLQKFDEIVFVANVSYDILFMQKLSREVAQELSIRVNFLDNSDPNAIISLYNQSSLVFTDRLHVALPAMINNSPAFPLIDLSLDQKILGVYKDVGWEKFVIPRPLTLEDEHIDFDLASINQISMSEVSDSIRSSRDKLAYNISNIFQ